MRVGKPVVFISAAVVVLLCYLAAFGFSTFMGDKEITLKGAKNVRLGIDINGGVEAYFEPKDTSIKPTKTDLESIRTILENRMDAKKIADREVTIIQESGAVLVRFPWASGAENTDPQAAIDELGQTAKLTFTASDTKEVFLEGKHVKKATAEANSGKFYVALELTSEGAKIFDEVTNRLYNGGSNSGSITIKLDDVEKSTATVNAHITDGNAIIEGNFTYDEVKSLADTIQAGALPFAIESRSFSTISPTLGNGALKVMLQAGLVAFILICLFMILYYRLPGLVACFGMAAQVAISVLILGGFQYTLTLAGIAGIILTLGMSIDTNVIISERIKEELNAGKTLRTSIDLGYHRAYSAIVDGNVTTLIVAVLLFWFGSGSTKSFGFTLGVGVAMNFLTGITLSRLMVVSLSKFRATKKPFLYGFKKGAVAK